MKALFRKIRLEGVQAVIVLVFGVVLAFAPDHFLTMLARAFLVQWAVVFLALIILAAWCKRWVLAGASALAALLVAVPVVPHHKEISVTVAEGSVLHVAQMNLLQPNEQHSAVINAARGTGADMISFQEVNARWANTLVDGLHDLFPYHRIVPQDDCYGIALFSKLPFEEVEAIRLTGHPVITATVRTPQGPVRVISVHATSPGSYSEFRDREEQLDRLAAFVRGSALPTVVIGDLNTVTWDHAFGALCANGELHEGPRAACATWPSLCGFALIPLDHVLVTAKLHPSAPRTFLIPGSDHRGLAVDVHIPPSQ